LELPAHHLIYKNAINEFSSYFFVQLLTILPKDRTIYEEIPRKISAQSDNQIENYVQKHKPS
jgi:GrpB-like predicted nucleotidyltransferase (UPF0157 family)